MRLKAKFSVQGSLGTTHQKSCWRFRVRKTEYRSPVSVTTVEERVFKGETKTGCFSQKRGRKAFTRENEQRKNKRET